MQRSKCGRERVVSFLKWEAKCVWLFQVPIKKFSLSPELLCLLVLKPIAIYLWRYSQPECEIYYCDKTSSVQNSTQPTMLRHNLYNKLKQSPFFFFFLLVSYTCTQWVLNPWPYLPPRTYKVRRFYLSLLELKPLPNSDRIGQKTSYKV